MDARPPLPASAPLESQLDATDTALAAAERQLAAAQAALRQLRRAAREGTLTALPARIAAAADSLAEAAGALRATGDDFTYDWPAAIADGSYVAELAAAATAAGLTLVRRDGRIIAYPVELRPDPRTEAVRIGKKPERRVRPSFLIARLKQAQTRPDRFNARGFLDRLLKPYTLLAQAEAPGWRPDRPATGPLVALADLHETLTLLPAAAQDYPREAFVADLLRLDRTPDARTARGHGFAFAGSTGKKGARRLTMFDEHGAQHDYFAIRLTLDA